ncbi:MAG: DUF4251 domain-containing protein [Chitinophagaceae bacterium]
MKRSNTVLKKLPGLISLILLFTTSLNAQDKDSALANSVEKKNYVFIAQTAQPSSGSVRQLTSEYRLIVKGDTLKADLPYFGRAYTAPIDPSNGGINFTSTDFDYNLKPKKKGGWSVSFKPKENNDVRQLILDISADGYANLQILSANRESISFRGYVRVGNGK